MSDRPMPVTGLEHCGNSPRMALTGELVVAWAQGDHALVAPWFDDDAVYSLAGTSAESRGSVDALAKFRAPRTVTHLAVHGLLSHGKVAACDGTATLDDGSLVDFAHHLTFGSAGKQAKIKSIRSYLIPRDR